MVRAGRRPLSTVLPVYDTPMFCRGSGRWDANFLVWIDMVHRKTYTVSTGTQLYQKGKEISRINWMVSWRHIDVYLPQLEWVRRM